MRKLVPSLLAVAVLSLVGCGDGDEPYKPAPVWSGRKPALPAPPQLPNNPIKVGDAYTIFGAAHQLKSRFHDKDVTGKDITIQGYIVDSNIPNAPACAVHKTGKKDDDTCKADIPSIWIADNKGEAKAKMRVIGFAKNFAVVFDAIEKYKNLKDPPKELVKDDVWNVDVPFPVPNTGAKVKITGKYGYSSSKSSTGLVTDPTYGVLTYGKIEYLEPSPDPAKFNNKK